MIRPGVIGYVAARGRRRVAGGLVVFAVLAGAPVVAFANPLVAPGQAPPEVAPPPSPFQTGMRGFGTGLAAGLAGGYLFAREDGFTSRDWRPMVGGAAIGALAGGTLGFTLGMIDNNATVPGRGYLVMRAMSYGGAFGAASGAIIGVLAALSTDKFEHIFLGAAIGTLAGTVAGVVVGSLEKNPRAGTARAPMAWNLGVGPVATGRGTLAFGPALSGRF